MRYSAKQIRPFRDPKGKQWTHPSVSELMKMAENDECPADVIQRLAHELVIEARSHGWAGPPFDPSLLASLEDIRVEQAPADMDADARIFPTAEGKLLIQYSPNSSKERRRFSIAHEIGHTRFPDCYERVRYRNNSNEHDFVHAELEALCNLAASEILMPSDEMASRTAGKQLSVELAERLRGVFEVSREAMLRRLCDLATVPCAVIFMSLRLKPSERSQASEMFEGFEGPKEKFRIDYSRSSASFPFHVPEHKSAPDNSSVYRAVGHTFPSRIEQWDIRNVGEWNVQAVELPMISSKPQSRVAAFITLPGT